MSDEPTMIDADDSAFVNLMANLPRSGETINWMEDETHPRQTEFRHQPLTIRQEPPIHTLVGDIVLLRQYVLVTHVGVDTVRVEQIVDDRFQNPDYYIIAGGP